MTAALADTPDADDLMARVAQGDRVAFVTLYDLLGGRIFAAIWRVVRNRSDAEDVAQETWLHVWRTADRFDAARGSALTWVRTIAHRRAVDRVRAWEVYRRVERESSPDVPAPYDYVAETVLSAVEVAQVQSCMGSLPASQLHSVQLAYWGGLTCREIALQTDTPIGTVKTRLRAALTRLRDCLALGAT